jgi:hypothetical protein
MIKKVIEFLRGLGNPEHGSLNFALVFDLTILRTGTTKLHESTRNGECFSCYFVVTFFSLDLNPSILNLGQNCIYKHQNLNLIHKIVSINTKILTLYTRFRTKTTLAAKSEQWVNL